MSPEAKTGVTSGDLDEAARLSALLQFMSRQVNPERLPALDWTEVARGVGHLAAALGVDIRAEDATLEATRQKARAYMAGQLQELRQELRGYAKTNGIRIFLFGSMRRGDFDLTSDVDLAFDTRDPSQRTIYNDLEEMCWRHSLKPDVIAMHWFGRDGLERLLASAVEI